MTGRTVLACAAVLVLAGTSAAPAGEYWCKAPATDGQAIHRVVYELESRIAMLQADPETNEGFKAPVISGARADISRLRASLGPARWRWVAPCCYSRAPIRIR